MLLLCITFWLRVRIDVGSIFLVMGQILFDCFGRKSAFLCTPWHWSAGQAGAFSVHAFWGHWRRVTVFNFASKNQQITCHLKLRAPACILSLLLWSPPMRLHFLASSAKTCQHGILKTKSDSTWSQFPLCGHNRRAKLIKAKVWKPVR